MSLKRRDFLLAAAGLAVAACRAKEEPSPTTTSAAESAPTLGPLLAPAELAARLDDVKSGKIAVLYVGPAALFSRGHVPGARNVGEASEDDGIRAIKDALAKTPPDTEIVLYCGCCPVRNCPNIRPASAAIRASGRKNARVLDLPTRFATDWTDKGFAVERG